jgi:hypothetical protein
VFSVGGKALDELGGLLPTKLNQTLNADTLSMAVGLREMSFVVKRETAQIIN